MTLSEVEALVRRRLVEVSEAGIQSPDDLEEVIQNAVNAYVLPDLFDKTEFAFMGSRAVNISAQSMTGENDYYYYDIGIDGSGEPISVTFRGKVTVTDDGTYDLILIRYDDLYRYKDYSLAYMRPGKLAVAFGEYVRVYEIDSGETVTITADYISCYDADPIEDIGLSKIVYAKLVVPKACELACSRMPEFRGDVEKSFGRKYSSGLRDLQKLYDKRTHPEEIPLMKYKEGGEDK